VAASLYERLGGESAVEAAVIGFYERIMADASLAPFFTHLDIDAQIKKQIAFMTMAFGGPNRYSGRDLRDAHKGLVSRGLGDGHFDAVAHHLKATLDELGIDAATAGEVLGCVGGFRNDVLDR
jgi:hemoglobin